jgi:REP-associated tyrosine transposase
MARTARVARRATATEYGKEIYGIALGVGASLSSSVTKFPRPPRRLDRVYAKDPVYFITCCTNRRRQLLASTNVHAAFVQFAIQGYADFGIAVGRYVILPDHLHLFVALGEDCKLGNWIGTLKRLLAREVVTDSEDPIWQRGFFDHILRSSESYLEKWNYVKENPVRAGLVTCATNWPYSGEIIDIYFD